MAEGAGEGSVLRRPRLCLAVVSVALVVALVAVGLLVGQAITRLPAANLDYSVTIAPGVHPLTPNSQVAAIARRYLDEQTPELAAPGLHEPSLVIGMAATLARDADRLEPGIPSAQAAARPERIVWVVRASGDFLDLHDLPWSRSGTPYPSGNIVIDDASATILGVYPHAPGT